MSAPNHHSRVVIVGSFAPSLITFRGDLIAEMVVRGHQVFALAPDIDPPIAASLRELGATPVPVALHRTNRNPLDAFRSAREFRQLFAELRPDLVIAYTIKPIVLAGPAARHTGARFVPMVTGMGYAFLGGLHPKRLLTRAAAALLYRRALRHASIVLFQNDDDRRDFRRHRMLRPAAATALIAGSGVDVGKFEQSPVPAEPVFLMIARYLRAKGVREYARAAAALKRDFPRARFCLVGWIDESPDAISPEELRAMTAQGIEDLGRLGDVRPALAGCSVYVLPSYREGTPRSVLEAMAVGRAIVTTDAPGCRETVIEGSNGFMVPVQDVPGLQAAMRRFLDDPDLAIRMGQVSRRMVEEKFDVRRVNQAILQHAQL